MYELLHTYVHASKDLIDWCVHFVCLYRGFMYVCMHLRQVSVQCCATGDLINRRVCVHVCARTFSQQAGLMQPSNLTKTFRTGWLTALSGKALRWLMLISLVFQPFLMRYLLMELWKCFNNNHNNNKENVEIILTCAVRYKSIIIVIFTLWKLIFNNNSISEWQKVKKLQMFTGRGYVFNDIPFIKFWCV